MKEFRFYYFTPLYDETVAFYRDVLGFEVYRTWDQPDGERGTIFRAPAGGGLIEIEAGAELPALRGGVYVEVDDVDAWHERVCRAGGVIVRGLADTSYGHRNFKALDPSGVEVAFFQLLVSGPAQQGAGGGDAAPSS